MNQTFALEDQRFLGLLLTRIGFWISYCDDTDKSEESESLERDALHSALNRITLRAKHNVIKIIGEAAKNYIDPIENETEASLTRDLKRAVALFNDKTDAEALKEFKRSVMYIGYTVARAFREDLDEHQEEFLLETITKKLAGFLNVSSDPEEFRNINVSPAEDSALTMIAEAMRE